MINKFQFYSALNFARFFCGKPKDVLPPELKGVYFQIANGQLTLSSANGQCASLISVPIETDEATSAIVRCDDVEMLLRMMKCDPKTQEELSISIDDSVTVFKTEHTELITEQFAFDKTFPDIRKLANREGKEPTGVPLITIFPAFLKTAASAVMSISNSGAAIYSWDDKSFLKFVVDPSPGLDIKEAFLLIAPMNSG